MATARVHVPALLLSLPLLLLPVGAVAQTASPAPTTTPAPPPAAAPAPGGAAAAPVTPGDPVAPGGTQGATTDPPKPKVEATGYGYSDPTPRRGGGGTAAPRSRRIAARASGPIATLPGFEMMPEGGSRFFVQLTQTVPVEEKRAAGTITYVLKGAHVVKHNNENALVTVHFNTPVSRARLVPQGGDLLFIVELRNTAQPTWKLEPAKDNGAVLAIDFPKGEFLGGPAAPTGPTADPNAIDTSRPRPASMRVKRKN